MNPYQYAAIIFSAALAVASMAYAAVTHTRLSLSLKRQRGLLRNNDTLTKTVDNLADIAQDQNDRVVAALSEVCAGLKAYAEDRSMRAAELADVLLGVHKLLADEEG